MFAIMMLIISDEFDIQQKEKPALKQIVERAKAIVKLEDYVEAYTAIYRTIPAFHSPDSIQTNQQNELLLEMIACDGKKPEGGEEGFVVSLTEPARIGNKM